MTTQKWTKVIEARRPLYLVLKEAVNNVTRHSKASRTAIRLMLENGALRLEVEDDGVGFDAAKVERGEGLRSITERMQAIGGTATWAPGADGGACFRAVLPLRRQRRWL